MANTPPPKGWQPTAVGAATAHTGQQDAIKTLASRADSARATGQNVPSPCVSVCRMDAQRGWCVGCLRTLDEIALWSRSSEDEKKRIWGDLAQRARQLNPGPPTVAGPTECDP